MSKYINIRHPNENEMLTTQFPYSRNGLETSRILKNWTFFHLWIWYIPDADEILIVMFEIRIKLCLKGLNMHKILGFYEERGLLDMGPTLWG